MHATHEVPGRVAALEEVLHRASRLGEFDPEGSVDLLPKTVEDRRCQVLSAGHRGGSRSQRLQLLGRRGRDVHSCPALLGLRQRAEGGHVPRSELAPVREDGWKCGPDFTRSELQQAMTRAACERLPETPGEPRLEGGLFVRQAQDETTVRGNDRSNGERTHDSGLLPRRHRGVSGSGSGHKAPIRHPYLCVRMVPIG